MCTYMKSLWISLRRPFSMRRPKDEIALTILLTGWTGEGTGRYKGCLRKLVFLSRQGVGL